MTCSNENRYLLARTAGSDIFGDLVDDPHGFFIGGLECVIGDVCTFVFVGVELLSETIFVIPDEKVRAIEHVLRRSEVLLKTHGVRIPALLEFEDIFDLGMAPGVNQLILVADNGDVRIVDRKSTSELQSLMRISYAVF